MTAGSVGKRRANWSLLVVALLCLLPVAAGVVLVLPGSESGQPLGWALLGFFGAGFVVLARKALGR